MIGCMCKYVDRSAFQFNRCSELEKIQNMLGYSVEQGYQLALAPINDKSDNPGYESVLGIYSSGQDNS